MQLFVWKFNKLVDAFYIIFKCLVSFFLALFRVLAVSCRLIPLLEPRRRAAAMRSKRRHTGYEEKGEKRKESLDPARPRLFQLGLVSDYVSR